MHSGDDAESSDGQQVWRLSVPDEADILRTLEKMLESANLVSAEANVADGGDSMVSLALCFRGGRVRPTSSARYLCLPIDWE
jgi:hypothetical protein